MRIIDLLNKKGIDLTGKKASKEETIKQLVDLMEASGNITDKEIFRKAVMAREEEGTTGIRRRCRHSPWEIGRCKRRRTVCDGCQRRD